MGEGGYKTVKNYKSFPVFEESENIRLVRLILKTYKSFPMFEKSENIRLIRLIRLIRVSLCSRRVRT